MSDFSEEDFEFIEAHVECGSENQSQSQTLLDFVDLLPANKLSATHKSAIKEFLLESELTIDDFTTNLTESNIKNIIQQTPIPLGPQFRFERAVLDLRSLHNSTNANNDPKQLWSCLETVAWMKRECPELPMERINSLEEYIREHNINGRCLFHPEARNAFKTNQAIPPNVRSQLIELVEKYERGNASEHKENGSHVVLYGNDAMYDRRWYWYNDKHGFILFDPIASAQITEAIFQGDREQVVLSRGLFFSNKAPGTYELIIDRSRPNGPHTQRNTRTRESRAVISELHEFISSGRNDALVKNRPRTF